MSEKIFNNFEEFLKTKGVNVVECFEGYDSKKIILSESVVEEQLKLLCEFHIKAMRFDGFLSNRIDNYTGKSVEEYKVYIKRLRREIGRLSSEKCSNEVEKFIQKQGEKYLERAEICIKQIYEWGYYDLLHRSMRRAEICLGDTYHDNIRKNNNDIEIINTKHLGYNMIENDCVSYFNKLRKKGAKFDWRKLTSKFCQYEGLGTSSEAFIIAMISYPHEFMRNINMYRYKKKDWTNDKYMMSIISAAEKDGESLL
jgi:hypothetical protein